MAEDDRERIAGIVTRFDGATVGVLGDISADVWTYTRPRGSTRPGAALHLRQEEADIRPGRAGNLAASLVALGADVRLVGVIGQDVPGELLIQSMARAGLNSESVIRSGNYLTPTRTMIVTGPPSRAKRLVVRIDQDATAGSLTNLSGKLLAEVRRHLAEADGWILSDHGFGAAAPGVASMIEGVKVSESRSRIDAFHGMTALVVSSVEAERAVGHDVLDEAQARRAAKTLLEKTEAGHLLLTRGGEGMILFAADGREGRIPPVTNIESADAFGAGDAAAAAFTLALAVGAPVEDAASIANLAGGLRVGRPANVQVSREELLAVLGG